MKGLEIERYSQERRGEWDTFVGESRNATFLHFRGYMDYHSDRFADHSYIFRLKGKPVGLLPANVTPDGVLHSHQGLTYGGLLLPQGHLDGEDVVEMFRLLLAAMREEGLQALDYKAIPWIYPLTPSQEDEYAIFALGGTLTECGLSSAADLRNPVKFNQLRRRNLKSAGRLPIEIVETEDIGGWMPMLEECLSERHAATPVHTAQELMLLRSRFPDKIRLFGVCREGSASKFDAGVCVYDTGRVAHLQYIATTERGREENLLTPLVWRLMTDTFAMRRYFDFGISTERGGTYLNAGLLRQKFSFGATGVGYNRYRLECRE